jgi:competence protein ComGC
MRIYFYTEVYTELDQSKRRNTGDEGFYQKLRKRDSDYVIPHHERRESYKDMKMGGYAELDQMERKREESQRAYQQLVKT